MYDGAMGELLRDPVWQFVGAALGLLALIVSVVSVMVYRNRKRLSYEVVTHTRLLTVDEEIEGRVKVTYDGHQVSGVRMVIVHLHNSGNVPIEKEDYDRPLGFWVKGGPKVLTAEVVKTKPPDIRARVETMENTVYLDNILLNPGDALSLKLLYTGDGPLIPVGRIKGVSEIKEKKQRSTLTVTLLAVLTILFLQIGLYIGDGAAAIASFLVALVMLILLWVQAQKIVSRTRAL